MASILTPGSEMGREVKSSAYICNSWEAVIWRDEVFIFIDWWQAGRSVGR